MKIAFRADGGEGVGYGHVMRCLTLADALARRGARCHFLSRALPGHLAERIAAAGHGLTCLPAKLAAGDDARFCLDVLGETGPWDWVVVDHYDLDPSWEEALGAAARRRLVIDDLGRPHSCELLLDQNDADSARYAGKLPPHCRALLGPRYALVRPEFAARRAAGRVRDGRIRRVLVFFGGADASGATRLALAALAALAAPPAVDVVVGAAVPDRADVARACAQLPACTLHVDTDRMAELMDAADLYVGAGGSVTWERLTLGLPGLVVAVAENQVETSRRLARVGAHWYLGRLTELSVSRLQQALELAQAMPETLLSVAQAAGAVTDGRGALRVAVEMQAEDVSLRRAGSEDAVRILEWRNHPAVRRYANDPAPIDHASHARWFAEISTSPNHALLIAEWAGEPLGVLRYDFTGERARVSIYVVPERMGQGWGGALLRQGERWLAAHRPEIRWCEAEIRGENLASKKIFERNGFRARKLFLEKELA